jgi:hypothetical protein
LRQKLSPFQAFQEADLNGNKVITTDELRLAIKKLIPDHELTPADFKMTMIAFDTNRNGSIDEKEFIKCISEARENAPPAQDLSPVPSVAKVSSKVSFSLENSISMIGDQDDNEEDYDVNKLVIRVIFENAKMPPNTLSQLAQKNLSILDAYWSKVDF